VEELGRSGLDCLERYEADGDDAALAAGLARLEAAAATAPSHPQRTRWWYGLGSAYECRAVERGSVGDYDKAVEWYARLYAELTPDDPDRTFLALTLTGACWSRYWLLRYGGTELPVEGAPPVDSLAPVDTVIAAARRWPVDGQDPRAAGFVRMIQGLARHERYGITGQRVDLDRAVLLLAGALPGLPDDTPWIAVATLTLAIAYRDRYATTHDEDTLDLAIETATEAVTLAATEAGTRLTAYEHLGLCLTERWGITGDPADLDRAIESVRAALTDQDDGWSAALCGELVRERAELNGDSADATEAVALLERSVRECEDDAVAAERWLELGRAHCTQWTVSGADESRETARRCFDRALRYALSDNPSLVDQIFAERLGLAEIP
jgi:tetratricopeptide (TPR) repeat protein